MNLTLSIILAVGSFVAQFVQTKQSQLFDAPQQSAGILTYRQPDYLRWEYTSPQPLVWELKGDKGNMSSQLKGMVMLIRESIRGDFEKARTSFDVTEEGDMITLVPRKRELMKIFRSIRITLNPDTRIADFVELTEAGGDITTIRFTDVQFTEL